MPNRGSVPSFLALILTPAFLLSAGSPTLPQDGAQAGRIAKLIEDLGSPDAKKRETAEKTLVEIGIPAVSALDKASRQKTPEFQAILLNILSQILPPSKILGELRARAGTPKGNELTIQAFVDYLRTLTVVPIEIGGGVDPKRKFTLESKEGFLQDHVKQLASKCELDYIVVPPRIAIVTRMAERERNSQVWRLSEKQVDLDCKGMPLKEAIDRLSRITGVPVFLSDSVRSAVDDPNLTVTKASTSTSLASVVAWNLKPKFIASIGIRNGIYSVDQVPEKVAMRGFNPPMGPAPANARKDFYGGALPPEASARICPVSMARATLASALAPDGRTLFTALSTNWISVWSVATGKELDSFDGGGRMYSLALSPEGRIVASGGASLVLWDATDGRCLQEIKEQAGRWDHMSFSPDGRAFVACSRDGTVLLWDLQARSVRSRLAARGGRSVHAAFSPDGKTLSTAGSEATIRLWDTATGKESRTLSGRDSPLMASVFSPDGLQVAAVDMAGFIFFWETATGKEIRRIAGGEIPIPASELVFSPDGQLVAMGREQGPFDLWDPVSQKMLFRFNPTYMFALRSLQFSPDGKSLFASAVDSTLVFDVGKKRPKRTPVETPPPPAPETLWDQMGGTDTAKAQAALRGFAGQGEAAAAFLKERLSASPSDPLADEIGRWIRDLNDDSVIIRDKASQNLKKLGASAEPLMRKALAATKSAEVKARLEEILSSLQGGLLPAPGEALRRVLGIIALEWIGTETARRALEELAMSAPTERERMEAKAALLRATRATVLKD